MARKARKIQDGSDDDDAPEVVSHSTSKANAKRHQRALHDFEAEEKARRKARNREKDQKLKERARVTKGERAGDKSKGVRFVGLRLKGEEQASDEDVDDRGGDDVEARMLRAMRDAENEIESGGGEDDDDDSDGRLGQDMDVGGEVMSGSDASFEEDEDDYDAAMPLEENDSIDPEALTDEEEMDEDEEDEDTPFQSNTQTSSKKTSYLADDLFTAAFASQAQGSRASSKKKKESVRQQSIKKRRRKAVTRAKDLVIGGRTIRTLPRPSDPHSQATARSVPSARARKFLDQNLALKDNKKAILKAKKKGWERRPANIGVMKSQGAPHGFVRSTR